MPANIIENFATQPGTGNGTPLTGVISFFTPFQTTFDNLKMKKANKDNEFNSTSSNPAMFNLLKNAKSEFKAYVESSGANTSFATTQERLDTELNDYDTNILNPLIQLRRNIINATNINTKMAELTKANTDLEKKKKDLELQKDNYTTAQVRNTVLNTHGEAISYHQAWGLIQRPIKKQSIPVLLVFTLLFLYVGILGIYYISPLPAMMATAWSAQLPTFSAGAGGGGVFVGLISSIVQSPFAVSIVISSAVILAIVLIMKFTGRV